LRRLCTKAASSADIVIVPRRISRDELARCKDHGDSVLETTLAHMVIVATRAKAGSAVPISTETLLRALLKKIPSPRAPYQLIDNPYTNWNQIDRQEQESRIEVVGPPRSSRGFQVFAAAVLDPACERWIRSLQGVERSDYDDMCRTLREDGVYQEAPWDNTFIRQRLWADPNLVGIIDYRFYSANSDDLAGSLLPGPAPTRESILNGSYAGARAIRFYVNGTRFERVPAVKDFVNEYLRREGLTFSQPLVPPDGHLGSPWVSRPANLVEATAQ
jgi:phosphate transport system substrate-binding protein